MVFAPPQHGKSQIVSKHFPAFWFGKRPDDPIILTSYAAGLAHTHSRDARNLVESSEYANLFGAQSTADLPVEIDGDSRAVDHWRLANHRGRMIAAGVGGGITGHGARLGIIDDPVENDKLARSKVYRDTQWNWYQATFRTRIWENGAIVLVMTRWHEDDLAGRLIKEMLNGGEQWHILRVPAVAESQAERDFYNKSIGQPIGQSDPLNRSEGEPLSPRRFSATTLAATKSAVGNRAWTSQYGGKPRPDEGRLLDSSKLIRVDPDQLPKFVRVVRRWDLAFSDSQGADYVAGAKMGLTADGKRYILHIKRIHGRWPQSKPIILQVSEDDGVGVEVLIEANGTQLGYFDDVKSDPKMAGRVVLPDKPDGNKEMRASVWGSRLEDGIYFCVRGEWNQDFFDEMDAFPNGENDDQIDAVSGANNRLTNDSGWAAFARQQLTDAPDEAPDMTV